jgi:predicted ATPase/DNA-binding SARP family transcriptional activator
VVRPPRTSFLGREDDLARLRDALAAHRVVTVTGGPGIGKTRLALEAAATPHVVDLTTVANDAAVAPATAAALGLRDARDLAAFAGLLLLDNCEHVLAGAADLADALDARVLATSREPLGVPGEYVLPLGPLPDADAVRLLTERATAAGGTAGGDAAELCRRLDGAPLAIELAAAALRTLSVDQLLERLDARLDLLVSGPRTAPERHRSLRAAIAASDALLAPPDRELLRRLAVFAGSFPLDAAERMGPAAALDRLVAKSLVVVEPGPRYRLPESVRVYAEPPPDAADGLVAWARDVASCPGPDREHEWVERVATEHANLDLAADRDPDLAVRLAPAWIANGRLDAAARHLADPATPEAAALAAQVALAAGRIGDARRHLEAAGDEPRAALVRAQLANAEADYAAVLAHAEVAARGDADTATAARIARATAYRAQGDYPAALAAAEDALAYAEALGFRRGVAASLLAVGGVRRLLGRYDEAAADYRRALDTASDPRTRAVAYGSLGSIAIDRAQPAEAVAAMTESLAASRECGDQRTTLVTLFNLAEAQRTLGDAAAARQRFGEALVIARALDERRSTGWILGALGDLALDEGDVETAARLFAESLTVREAVLDRRGLAVVLDGIAAVAVRRGGHYDAARLLAAATTLREALGAPREPALQTTYDALLAEITAAIDDAPDALAAGAALSLPKAVRAARRALDAEPPAAPARPATAPRATRHVRTLGGFAVLHGGVPVDPRAWQSKKARDLLKILVAHRGRPVHREALADLLWPDGDPAALPNRLSVALSTLRSVLDPGRDAPAPVVVADRTAVALNLDAVDVDVETFFAHVAAGREEAAEAAYAGDFLPEDAYEEWSVAVREQARLAYVTAARSLARAAARNGDADRAATLALRILEHDPYDEQAHRTLVAALRAAGRHGDAAHAERTYRERMAEIGLKTT